MGIDVTIVSPLPNQYLSIASTPRAGATEKAERFTTHKYAALCATNDVEFLPLAIDVYAGMGPNAKTLLRRIAQHLSKEKGTVPITEHCSTALALERVTLQDTAAAVNRRRIVKQPLKCKTRH